MIFAPAVVPLITRLEERFTKYDIDQISGLSSAYSVRLYELLIQWRSTGKTPVIELADFRKRIGVLDTEYKRMAQLKERVLELAIKQINEHTDIIVTYKQHKAGRVITGFSFAFTQKKQSIDVTPKPKKLKPTEDLNTLLHDKKFLEKHARAGESWDDVRSRLKNEAETGKFSLAPTN
mgnify:FL=1